MFRPIQQSLHPYETSIHFTQDSRTLHDFFIPNPRKSETMKQKRQQKEKQGRQKKRKDSTQLSLFDWVVKKRPKQTSYLTNLSKDLIMTIYSFLRISDISVISQSCFFFYQCAKTIWSNQDFFKQLQTDKLTAGELRSILSKGSRMEHIKQLRSLYQGKNLKSCREKIKVKVQENQTFFIKPAAGNLLETFEVSTKILKSSAFVMDSHLQGIINSSFHSLTQLKLQSCRYVRKFFDISKCRNLTSLIITQNTYLTNEDMRLICKNCSKIQILDISGCNSLDQGIFKHISKLINLKTLVFNGYQQPFGDLQCLKVLCNLHEVSLQNSCIIDSEGIQLVREVQSLEELNLNGCQLLTDFFIQRILAMSRNNIVRIKTDRTNFSNQMIKELKKKQDEKEKKQKTVSEEK